MNCIGIQIGELIADGPGHDGGSAGRQADWGSGLSCRGWRNRAGEELTDVGWRNAKGRTQVRRQVVQNLLGKQNFLRFRRGDRSWLLKFASFKWNYEASIEKVSKSNYTEEYFKIDKIKFLIPTILLTMQCFSSNSNWQTWALSGLNIWGPFFIPPILKLAFEIGGLGAWKYQHSLFWKFLL